MSSIRRARVSPPRRPACLPTTPGRPAQSARRRERRGGTPRRAPGGRRGRRLPRPANSRGSRRRQRATCGDDSEGARETADLKRNRDRCRLPLRPRVPSSVAVFAICRRPPSEVERIEPIQPGMGPDRDLAHRRKATAAGVDRRNAMRSDRKLVLILVIELDLDGVLAERIAAPVRRPTGSVR